MAPAGCLAGLTTTAACASLPVPCPRLWCSYPLPDLLGQESDDDDEEPEAGKQRGAGGSAQSGSGAHGSAPCGSAAGLAGPLGEHFAGGGMQAALAGAVAEAVHGVAGELAPGAGMGARAPSGSGPSAGAFECADVGAGTGNGVPASARRKEEGHGGVAVDQDDAIEITRHTKHEARGRR